MINYAQLAQGVLWVDTRRLKMKKKRENKVTGLFFSSDEALSRDKSFKTAVFPGSSGNWCGFLPHSIQTCLVWIDQPSSAGLLPA